MSTCVLRYIGTWRLLKLFAPLLFGVPLKPHAPRLDSPSTIHSPRHRNPLGTWALGGTPPHVHSLTHCSHSLTLAHTHSYSKPGTQSTYSHYNLYSAAEKVTRLKVTLHQPSNQRHSVVVLILVRPPAPRFPGSSSTPILPPSLSSLELPVQRNLRTSHETNSTCTLGSWLLFCCCTAPRLESPAQRQKATTHDRRRPSRPRSSSALRTTDPACLALPLLPSASASLASLPFRLLSPTHSLTHSLKLPSPSIHHSSQYPCPSHIHIGYLSILTLILILLFLFICLPSPTVHHFARLRFSLHTFQLTTFDPSTRTTYRPYFFNLPLPSCIPSLGSFAHTYTHHTLSLSLLLIRIVISHRWAPPPRISTPTFASACRDHSTVLLSLECLITTASMHL